MNRKQENPPIREQTQLTPCHTTTILSVSRPHCCFDGSYLQTFPPLAQNSECRSTEVSQAWLRPQACPLDEQGQTGRSGSLGGHGRKCARGPAFLSSAWWAPPEGSRGANRTPMVSAGQLTHDKSPL